MKTSRETIEANALNLVSLANTAKHEGYYDAARSLLLEAADAYKLAGNREYARECRELAREIN